METKICKCCNIEKNIEDFRYSNGYYRGDCKKCEALKHNEYAKTHKNVIKEINHRTYINNIDKFHKRALEKREQMKLYNKEYYSKNKEYYKEYAHKYHLEHRNQKREQDKKWRERNKDKVKQYQQKDYFKRKNDPVLKLQGQLRNMVKEAFKRKKYKKSKKLEEICCCTIDELIEHLINTYEINYNEKWDWNFVNDVHIDHIKPLAVAKTEGDVIRLNHYTNLQLLKAEDNLKKGAKIDYDIHEC